MDAELADESVNSIMALGAIIREVQQCAESSGGTSLVPMMEATNFGDRDHPFPIDVLDFAMFRGIHLQRETRARVVIVVEVVAHFSPQMPLI